MEKVERVRDIGQGKGCFVVSDGSFLDVIKDNFSTQNIGYAFIKWLESEGFEEWKYGGWWQYESRVYINIESKCYAPGKPGIRLTGTVGSRCITIDEFKTIYEIFKRHEGDVPQ